MFSQGYQIFQARTLTQLFTLSSVTNELVQPDSPWTMYSSGSTRRVAGYITPTALVPKALPTPSLQILTLHLTKKTNQNKKHIKMLQSNKQQHFKLFHWTSFPSWRKALTLSPQHKVKMRNSFTKLVSASALSSNVTKSLRVRVISSYFWGTTGNTCAL